MTVIEAMRSKLGLVGATRLMTWVMAWSLVLEESKSEPTPELMQELGYSASSHYRRLAEFREVFPTQKSPTVMLALAQERVAKRRVTHGRLGKLDIETLFA